MSPSSLIGFIWFALIALSAFLIGAIVVAVLFIRTDSTGFDPGNAQYRLYKNTRVEACYNSSPPPDYNCTGVREMLSFRASAYGANGSAGVLETADGDVFHEGYTETVRSWCEALSRFSEFKVVPSEPRDSAYWEVTLSDWAPIIVGLLLAAWHTHSIYMDSSSIQPACKGIGWDDWVGVVWAAGSSVFWWVNFGRWAADPSQAARPSMMGWLTTWQYSEWLAFHPFSCGLPFLRNSPDALAVAQWTLRLIAAVQWGVGAHVSQLIKSDYTKHAVYSCLSSQISTAPGTFICSAEQICSQDWLFSRRNSPGAMHAACPYGSAILSSDKGFGYWRNKYDKYNSGPIPTTALGSAFVVLFGAWITASMKGAFDRDREGPVMFYWECAAMHVNVSPWRYYMDVEGQWEIRIARMLLNA
ncbi:hypothetical protein BJY04DRAFT_224254 [Aspergillus karnatakaensis]|uniref:uncharacterized protein n=1 Tax=Aspergillus karnatakaensis TaxID=1810916 RepID=UPI003CCD8927